MQSLELKVPPPVVAVFLTVVMWGISRATPAFDLPMLLRVGVAVAIALAGGSCSISGAVAFRRARTTVNPMKPESASSLVRSGIYRVTRNPMYVGLLMVLVAWAVFLSAPVSFLGPVAFFLYIGRFQIVPEERVLARLFGAEYSEYTSRVRRWL
jgi:protein-S-isoprenylcysteine O-methyltransferase Ste14